MAARKLFKSLDPNSSPPTDVIFLFKENGDTVKEVKAHKLILAIASDVFDREFFGTMKEAKGTIDIIDATQEVFKVMVEFVYNNQFIWKDYDLRFLASLYYLAEKYNIGDLREEIIASIPNHRISKGNVLEIAILAEDNIHHQPLSEVLYDSAANFLKDDFKGNFDSALNFFYETEDNEIHALVIFKIMARMKKMKPTKYRQIELFLVYMDPLKSPTQFKVKVSRSGTMSDMCATLGKLSNIPDYFLVVTDVYNHRFHKIYTGEDQLSHILDRDDIFVYEIDNSDPSNVTIPVYSREKTNKTSDLFGQPLLCSLPKSCTASQLYDTLLQRMARYVSRPAQGDKWWMIPDGDSDQGDHSSGEVYPNMFSLHFVNSYGNSVIENISVQKGKVITISSDNYLSLDWYHIAKQKFFNKESSENFDIAE